MHKCTKSHCRICFWPNWGLQTRQYPLNTRTYSTKLRYHYVMVHNGPGAIYPYRYREGRES